MIFDFRGVKIDEYPYILLQGVSARRKNTMKNLPQKLPACCFLFLLLTAASVFSAELPKTITGVVTRVADGDTIYVLDKSETEHTIRLDGIDAPERNQDFAAQSKKYLSDLVLGEQVTVHVTKRDRNLRTVGRLWKSEMDVEYEMVAAGMAWHFDKFNNEQKLADAQQAAGESKIGLWVYENPIPP